MNIMNLDKDWGKLPSDILYAHSGLQEIVRIDLDKIIAIEAGPWSDIKQDYLAIAICYENTRVELPLFVKELTDILEKKDAKASRM